MCNLTIQSHRAFIHRNKDGGLTCRYLPADRRYWRQVVAGKGIDIQFLCLLRESIYSKSWGAEEKGTTHFPILRGTSGDEHGLAR